MKIKRVTVESLEAALLGEQGQALGISEDDIGPLIYVIRYSLNKGLLLNGRVVIPDGIAHITESRLASDSYYWIINDKYIPINLNTKDNAERREQL